MTKLDEILNKIRINKERDSLPEYYFFDVEGRLLPISPTKDILERGTIKQNLFDRDCYYPLDVDTRLRVLHTAFTTTKRMKWGD